MSLRLIYVREAGKVELLLSSGYKRKIKDGGTQAISWCLWYLNNIPSNQSGIF